MTLANKYLRYSPEITLEIFKLVWDKFEQSGYDLSAGINTIFRNWKTWIYIIIEGNDICTTNRRISNLSEATVQEILGYDPFVNKEVIPEYVECIGLSESKVQGWSNHYTIGNIYKLNSKPDYNFTYIVGDDNEEWACDFSQFKPSTKEAFDAQNQPKSIEKWSVGSYVVFLNSEIQSNGFNKGDIQQIREYNSSSIIYYSVVGNTVSDKGISEQIKWFATKSEAEKFAKILVEPVNHCNGILDAVDVKHPLKQAVHCETQEQWNFVIEKVGYSLCKNDFNEYKSESCVILNSKNHMGSLKWATKENYQILSFSDWCAQSNYEFLSTEDKYKEVLRKNARTLGGEVVEIDLADYDALSKNMFDFNVSEQTANNLSETIDRVRYMAMQTAQADMLENALKSFTCDIQHYDHEFLAQMLGGKVSKVNKVQISTDNEIKINIIQKQSIKI